MPRDTRSLADSLCAQPATEPRDFHWFVSEERDLNVYQEVIAVAWDRGRSAVDAAGIVGDVLGKMRAGAKGELRDGSELEPVRRYPPLWEIKWKLGKRGELRLYHAEPGAAPDLVALRFHEKDTSSHDPDRIEALQDAEMDEAERRHDDGVNRRWGHRHPCANCLTH